MRRTLKTIVRKGENGERYRYVWDPKQKRVWVQEFEDGLYSIPVLMGQAETEELFLHMIEDLTQTKGLEVKRWTP